MRLVNEELTPGLYISNYVNSGFAYKVNASLSGLSAIADSDFALVISESDWKRIPETKQEELLDKCTKKYAEKGIDELKNWLELAIMFSVWPEK
jgi:hypothetical protein